MDLVPEFLEQKIPVGNWARTLVEYLTDNFHAQFRIFSDGLDWLIQGFVFLLSAIPPLVFITGLVVLSFWLHRKIRFAIGIGLSL